MFPVFIKLIKRLSKNRCAPRESNLGRMARRERGACPCGPVTSEQRCQESRSALARKVALLFCLRGVARRSQIHCGYAPSSRLAQAKHQSATRYAWVFQQSLRPERHLRGSDLKQLGGDASLTHLVVLESEILNKFLGVVRGVFHRHHARAVLGRARVEDHLENLILKII